MKRLTLVAALAALFSAHAVADTVKLSDFAFANERNIAFKITTASGTESSYAGGFATTVNGQSFLTYCVDLLQTFSWGTTYTDFSLASVGSGTPSWYTASKANDLGRLFTGYADDVTDYITSAAFQLATWAIVTENTAEYSVLGNGLVARPYYGKAQETQAINLAETWLHGLPGYSNYLVSVEYSPRQQDLIMAAYVAPDSHVPEPGTVGLLAGALGLMAVRGRRLALA